MLDLQKAAYYPSALSIMPAGMCQMLDSEIWLQWKAGLCPTSSTSCPVITVLKLTFGELNFITLITRFGISDVLVTYSLTQAVL